MSPETRRSEVLRGDLRAMTSDGICFSAMVGLGEAYVPAFALALGHGAAAAGLIATLPLLVGSCFQLVTPEAVRRLRSYRRWVVGCARLQALCFVPLALAALFAWGPLAALLAVASVYWGFSMATGPAWNAWATTLVPARLRVRYFARRSRSAQASLLIALVCSGAVLETGRRHQLELPAFAALFVLAAGARLLSARFLASQSEDPRAAQDHRRLSLRDMRASVQRRGTGRVVAYLLAMPLAAYLAAPYFTPYMLGPLALSYERFTALIAASFLARIAVLPLLARLAQRRGSRFVLIAGALGIVPLPPLWLVSHGFAYLFGLQLASGCAWAAVEYASLLSFFEGIEERDRASVLSLFNLANAASLTAGSLLGGLLFGALGSGEGAYAGLFVASCLARLAIVALLRLAPSARTQQPPVPLPVPAPIMLRTLAVRPASGALQRPILAAWNKAGGRFPVRRRAPIAALPPPGDALPGADRAGASSSEPGA